VTGSTRSIDWRIVIVASLLLMCGTALARAADGAAAAVDDDYPLQGEYVGTANLDGQVRAVVGLQSLADGEGRFKGLLYMGGLPGAGWDGSPPKRLEGLRESGRVHFSGAEVGATVSSGEASVFDPVHGERGHLWRVVRTSPTLDAAPPQGATVLFDGAETDELSGRPVVDDRMLLAGATTREAYRDFYLHVEFRTPYSPSRRGQGRGNSGVYIQQRYEVQILDSFALDGAFNECGALYRQRAPDVNACLPPLSWQTYDIWFTAARFDGEGRKIADAIISVLHNGVVVHHNVRLKDKTGAGQPEAPDPRPIQFQNHGDPVYFRNVWIAPARPWEDFRPARADSQLPGVSGRSNGYALYGR